VAAIRPHPHRGDIVAMGVVPLTLAVVVADVRMESAWGDLPHLALVAVALAFVGAMAMLAPLERPEGPRAYHSVLLVAALVLGALGTYRLGRLLGAGRLFDRAGTLTWSLALFGAMATAAAYAKRSAFCTLVAALAFGGAFVAFCDWVFDLDGASSYRWLLLILMAVFAVRSLGLREARPRQAVAMVNSAAASALALAVLNAITGAGWGWELVVVATGFGVLAYASSDRENGSAYLGGLILAAFVYAEATRGGASLLGWPLALALMSLVGLGLGLRPRRELPPPPDADEPGAETVPLPAAQRADPDLGL
jgi:hypothetical protein